MTDRQALKFFGVFLGYAAGLCTAVLNFWLDHTPQNPTTAQVVYVSVLLMLMLGLSIFYVACDFMSHDGELESDKEGK